jgi:hypothetical protein
MASSGKIRALPVPVGRVIVGAQTIHAGFWRTGIAAKNLI